MPKPVGETRGEEEIESKHIFIKEDSMKKSMPPLFPQALRGKKKASKKEGILEVLRQVKVNIPLLDMIKQVPTYENFLNDLCTVKKGLGIDKKAFLTELHHPVQNLGEIQRSRIPHNLSQHWRDRHR